MISHEDMSQALAEDAIQQEDAQTIKIRAQRFRKAKPHSIVPYTEFAPVSVECVYLFRDGHFYGCIALAQSVAEAIARFLCQKNSWKPDKTFEKNIKKLHNRKLISDGLKDNFLKIWKKRDDYHHLNPKIETDRIELEKTAYDKILLLNRIESEIFKFSISKAGKLIPDNKKYWEETYSIESLFFNPLLIMNYTQEQKLKRTWIVTMMLSHKDCKLPGRPSNYKIIWQINGNL